MVCISAPPWTSSALSFVADEIVEVEEDEKDEEDKGAKVTVRAEGRRRIGDPLNAAFPILVGGV